MFKEKSQSRTIQGGGERHVQSKCIWQACNYVPGSHSKGKTKDDFIVKVFSSAYNSDIKMESQNERKINDRVFKGVVVWNC